MQLFYRDSHKNADQNKYALELQRSLLKMKFMLPKYVFVFLLFVSDLYVILSELNVHCIFLKRSVPTHYKFNVATRYMF